MKMNVRKVEEINELISKAEIASAKSQGQMEAIKAEWKKLYGTDDENEIKNKLQELETEEQKTVERQEVLYEKLVNAYDWETLEEELC
jgi:hypothetical protein